VLTSRVQGIWAQILVICFYAFREIYVSLLSTQQWAFISMSLDKNTSGYLVSFSGIVSIASSVGGCTVVQLVNVGGVQGLLVTTVVATILGLICAEVANSMSEYEKKQHISPPPSETNSPRDPKNPSSSLTSSKIPFKQSKPQSLLHQSVSGSSSKQQHQLQQQQWKSSSSPSVSTKSNIPKSSFWRDSWALITTNYVLQVLFYEALSHQFCSNMLNLMFHNALRSSTHSNEVKAKLVGRFFAVVNVSASLLQCFVFPLFLNQATLPYILRYLPFIIFFAILLGVIHPGTITVMIGFGSIKILEYSVMHSAAEMIYMPLGHELRYVGKELVKFFGTKVGKSISSLILSLVINQLNLSLSVQSIIGAGLTIVWGFTIFRLSDYLLQRERMIKKEISEGNRARTKSEEVRLHTSRSMSLFDIPEDEEQEEEETPIFFRSVSSSNLNDQPEDFFYGSPTSRSPETADVSNNVLYPEHNEEDEHEDYYTLDEDHEEEEYNYTPRYIPKGSNNNESDGMRNRFNTNKNVDNDNEY
jgi:hypothetical protein